MNVDERLTDRARFLLFSTLELLRKEIRSGFSDWKDADDWLFSQLDLTKGELAQIYEGRNVMYYDGSAVDFEAAERIGQERRDAEESVKLEPGMVGVLKYADDVPPEIQGAPFQVVRVSHIPGYAECAVDGMGATYMVHAEQMKAVGPVSSVLGDVFETRRVDGRLLAGVERAELIEALKQAPVGTVITGVRNAPGSYGYGKYDFDTHIEKHGGYMQNYFAPVKTSNYDTWWEIGGAKRHEYDLADILQGKSRYYALTENGKTVSLEDKMASAVERSVDAKRSTAGGREGQLLCNIDSR